MCTGYIAIAFGELVLFVYLAIRDECFLPGAGAGPNCKLARATSVVMLYGTQLIEAGNFAVCLERTLATFRADYNGADTRFMGCRSYSLRLVRRDTLVKKRNNIAASGKYRIHNVLAHVRCVTECSLLHRLVLLTRNLIASQKERLSCRLYAV